MTGKFHEAIKWVAASLRTVRPLTMDAATAALTLNSLALLVIDVQEVFCLCPLEKERSKHIARLVPEFRRAGVAVYPIRSVFKVDPLKPSEINFHEFQPHLEEDTIISKERDSAFDGTDIHGVLQAHGRKSVIACGFNFEACVQETLMDARKKGYQVSLMEDLSNGNDDLLPSRQTMVAAGIEMVSSGKMLQRVEALKMAARI